MLLKNREIMNSILETDEFTLLKEMQHRMKNNLQLILSLINIQLSKNVQETNKDFLTSLKQRIHSLSLINNFLDHTCRIAFIQNCEIFCES